MSAENATPLAIARPKLTFPKKVGAWVREHFEEASVILEYGSGGSTVMASEMDGKRIYSVESDANWCAKMNAYFAGAGARSPVVMHHEHIGETGDWGHPETDANWRNYHRYPNTIWDREGFEAPDLVLLDGRFRAACFVTTMLRTLKPVTVLFDDYLRRPKYKLVERWFQPTDIRGRMARFDITPIDFPRQDLTEILSLYTKPS